MHPRPQRLLGPLIALAASLGATGCAGKSEQPSHAEMSGGGNGGAEGLVGGGGANMLGGSGNDCPGPTPASQGERGRIDLPVQVTVGDLPIPLGEPRTSQRGREYTLSLLKFFVATPAFLDAGGGEAKAQLVSADGAPLPYGVHLVDVDEPATQLLRLTAPPGTYAGLRFGVGLPAACNAIATTDRVYPLNPDSDMFWTWGSQFLFVRAEGNARAGSTLAWEPFAYHVGYDPAYTTITVPGVITVGVGGEGPVLALDVDRMLNADGPPKLSTKHDVPDGWVVDNLENNQAFTLQ